MRDTPRKWAVIARALVGAARTRRRARRGDVRIRGGPGAPRPVADTVDYVERVFADYVRYGELDAAALEGRRVLELGPGDNLGVALRFVAAGARHVVCLDRFECGRDPVREGAIYRELRRRLPARDRARFDDAVALDGAVRIRPERVRALHGVGAERARLDGAAFDLIVSRAVLEEIDAIDEAFAVMDRALARGGRMLHKIDLSDYGLFSARGFHPLEFLTVPERIYRPMTRDASKPNRRLADYYRRAMATLGYTATLYRTSALPLTGYVPAPADFPSPVAEFTDGVHYQDAHRELIRRIRPRLRAPFRALADEDLLTSSLFLVAAKP